MRGRRLGRSAASGRSARRQHRSACAALSRAECSASPLPFAVTASRGSYSKTLVTRYVPSPTTIPPTGASAEPRSGVHDVARDHPLAFCGPRVSVTIASPLFTAPRTASSSLDARCVELVDRGQDAQRRAHRALGIVFVRDRRTEDRHDRVADELLHRAAEPSISCFTRAWYGRRRRADVLRIGLLGRRR